MSVLVERVAKAIAEDADIESSTMYEDMARTAVKAMRDIDPRVVARAADRLGVAPSDVARLVGTWHILIDEALA